MSDAITMEGIEYISSKRAAELSGYTQDYIGQLARSGAIAARRVSGLWYISMQSLNEHKAKAESYVPTPPKRAPIQVNTNTHVVSMDGKNYISAARAAKLTGYHQDYVAQLAREGKVLARQVGGRWHVDQEAIQAHKQEKDALLAKVQAESVGIQKPKNEIHEAKEKASEELSVKYFFEDSSLTPIIRNDLKKNIDISASTIPTLSQQHLPEKSSFSSDILSAEEREKEDLSTPVPIRVVREEAQNLSVTPIDFAMASEGTHTFARSLAFGSVSAVALTIVLIIAFSEVIIRSSAYAALHPRVQGMFTASAAASETVAEFLEQIFTEEIKYIRSD